MCSPYGIGMKGIFLKMQKQETSASTLCTCPDFLFFVSCEAAQNALAFSFKRFLVGVWGYLLIATLEITERSGVIYNAGQKGSPH